jgi:four helix bundle protein
MSGAFRSYRDLEVWQLGMSIARQVYQLTASFPNEERFGLTSQLRRAAVSIPANIAEGHARSGTGEFLHFLSIAMGSLAEVETYVLLGADFGYIDSAEQQNLLSQLDRLGKMLRGLHRTLAQRR